MPGEERVGPQPGAPEPQAGGKGTKRKVAVFLAYVGAGYYGMQRNPPFPTIESELEAAMVKAGAISDLNAGSFSKIHWMRAARTDKGVSACCQVVSAKLVIDPQETFARRINEHLPRQIRIFGFGRTTNGFDSRKHCDKRRYEYVLPAWALDPDVAPGARGAHSTAGAGTNSGAVAASQAERAAAASLRATEQTQRPPDAQGGCSAAGGSAAGGAQQYAAGNREGGFKRGGKRSVDSGGCGADMDVTAATSGLGDDKLQRVREEVAAAAARCTLPEERRAALNSLLAEYVGTHNFHNFTVGVAAADQQACTDEADD